MHRDVCPEETYVSATKFGWPCDAVSEKLSIVSFW